MKSALTKQIINEQVEHLATKVIKSGIHISDDYNFIIIPKFRFPENWHSIPGIVDGEAQVLVAFRDDYPMFPPIGFYIDARVESSPNGHLYSTAMHNAPTKYTDDGDWKWYCAYVSPGEWQPAAYTHPKSWLDGHNLFTFFVLMQEVLASKRDDNE